MSLAQIQNEEVLKISSYSECTQFEHSKPSSHCKVLTERETKNTDSHAHTGILENLYGDTRQNKRLSKLKSVVCTYLRVQLGIHSEETGAKVEQIMRGVNLRRESVI